MKSNSGTTILILTFLLSLFVGFLIAIGAPPVLTAPGMILCGALGTWGFFAFFGDWFRHLNQESQRRHIELINELRRIYPPYTPPAAPPSDIQKLTSRK